MSYEDEDAGRHAEIVKNLSNEEQQKFYALCDKDGLECKTVEGIWAVSSAPGSPHPETTC